MRPEQQTDIFRDDPRAMAEVWSQAAETSRQQFPDDTARYAHYIHEAERPEAIPR
ncbi:hypothetical protein [Pseudoxanthomonas sp. JBR18]|uniref:hypothetical protein n=1 Tax=Pseudoxanthomonas sp. JBR18 TaxID=2969308 RepID=UPI0023064FDF|nr:hypothetical protein [Pseudoxanthomonas sp. JBR18]WCE04470.1 hypothetical protein PJ250_00205 [Pseudoxanthomonas sp. JBR18]